MMARAVAVAAFSAILLVDGFRVRPRKRRTAGPGVTIVNGSDAEACVWKWQVGIYRRGGDSPFCGGSLLSPTWVVTAKHCVIGYSYDVMAGSILLGQGERRISRRIVLKQDSDMALIELSEPFTLDNCTNVPALPKSEIPTGSKCWITGWGRLNNGGSQPSTLQQAETTVVGYEECNSQMDNRINASDVCVLGDYNGNPTSACNGDSGGPLVCETDGEFTLYGTTSWGYGCTGISVYDGVYSAMDWISSYVFAPPVPTPAPGTWAITGSGCEMDGSCIQTLNFPANYSNDDECTIELYGAIDLRMEAFWTERRYDILTMDGVRYFGVEGPPNGTYTGSITWSADYTVTSPGWRLCKD